MTFNRRLVFAIVCGFLLGSAWLVAIRFVTQKDTRVHYHANFALYINGKRDELKSPTYYEETAACSADEIGPKSRVHLHELKSSVIHVHDNGVTWGHMFSNIGYGLTNKSVTTDNKTYVDGENNTEIHFILNGKEVSSIANELIQSEDTLVVDVVDSTLKSSRVQPESPKNEAAEYNQKSDPSACSGSKPLTFSDRLKKAIGIGN